MTRIITVILYILLNLALCIYRAEAAASYVGSDVCKSCHANQFQQWQGSHHAKAMEKADKQTVLGDFNDKAIKHDAEELRFFTKGNDYFVEIKSMNVAPKSYRLPYTFGVYPLQQYLMELPNGKYQALTMAWDSRDKSEGGQQWFDLYSEQKVNVGDPLHWSSPLHNWNSRCAACHSTNLQKNYSISNDSYQTQWSALNVDCEACHGSASAHLQWVESPTLLWMNKGFNGSLASTAQWQKMPGQNTAVNYERLHKDKQFDVCSSCHSLRAEIGNHNNLTDFHSQYQSNYISDEHFYADGTIKDEVFERDSFLQSKMYANGVVCSNCHNPHSAALKIEGNALCAQCHEQSVFDNVTHHHHTPDSKGSLCVNCHMPAKNYMVIDARRDHGFSIPRPPLTKNLGIPNSCNQCHADKEAQWSIDKMLSWNLHKANTSHPYADYFSRAWAGEVTADGGLLHIITDNSYNTIVKASALQALEKYPLDSSYAIAVNALKENDAMLRVAAVRALHFLAPDNRQVLYGLIKDKSKAVRMELAPLLADVPQELIPADDLQDIDKLFDEYIQLQMQNADMPEVQQKLGDFYARKGGGQKTDGQKAEMAYLQSLKKMPAYLPSLINLAQLYRQQGNLSAEKKVLKNALLLNPDAAEANYALGLFYVRENNLSDALLLLGKAMMLDKKQTQYAYVYAAALHKNGKTKEAVTALETANDVNPDDKKIVEGLLFYYRELKDTVMIKFYELEIRRLNGTGE